MSLQIQAVVPPPDVYSIEGFGRAFGFGKSFLYEEIATGRLKARKAGRKTLILRTDALDYLESLPPAKASDIDRRAVDAAQAPAERIVPNETPERYRRRRKT